MTTLFKRRARLIVPSLGKVFDGLRVSFKIKKSLEKEPNTADIVVYNLSDESRAAFKSKGTRVILEAGYESNTAVIFSGDTSFVDHVHEGPDWKSVIECGDGEIATQFARISEAFKPPVTKAQIFQKLAAAMGVDAAQALTQIKDQVEQFVSGYVAHGKASAEIDRLLKGTGFSYSIQDGALQVLKSGDATPAPVILLTPDTGLIGSPQHGNPIKPTKDGLTPKKPQVLKAKSLIQPAFAPGRRVMIDSLSVKKGVFVIYALEHSGDTHGQDWYTDLELTPYSPP